MSRRFPELREMVSGSLAWLLSGSLWRGSVRAGSAGSCVWPGVYRRGMKTSIEQRRRRDEKVQEELLGGMQRILDVLHDISDGVRDLQTTLSAQRPASSSLPSGEAEPLLLSIADAAELVGIKPGSFRTLCDASHGPPTVRIGKRIYLRRTDLEKWLDEARPDPRSEALPWRSGLTRGGIGSTITKPAPVDRPWCTGSHTEPKSASQYHGRGLCRVCRDDVLINRNGLLPKHRSPSW